MRHFYKKAIQQSSIYINDIEVPALVYWLKAGEAVRFPKGKIFWAKNRGKHKRGYYLLYAGFDIETTNKITDEYKRAFMYIWQFAICSDTEGYIYLGRTWEDFEYLINQLNLFYDEPFAKLLVWDANFGFEFQFIRKHLEWEENKFDFFAKEERKPLVATCGSVQFRECLSISGGGLADLARDYTKTQKLVGDLDYKIERNSNTPITGDELQYCINDVVILCEFSAFIFTRYIIPDKKVPLTKTGLLRREVKAELAATAPDLDAYMEYIRSAFPDEVTYRMWFKYLFRGGYVHANFTLANLVIESGMMLFDITSSYPARMNLSYFPVTPFKSVKFKEEYLTSKCCVIYCRFTNIDATTFHSIESQSKIIEYSTDAKFDNGRLYHASYIEVLLTELDFENYTHFYRWDKLEVLSCLIAKRGKLPKFIRDVLNRYYIEKAELKASGLKDTPQYAIKKSGVNAAFGMMVTRLSLDVIAYEGDEWKLNKAAIDYAEEVKGQFLLPQWGIYVAAAARHELLTVLWRITERCGNVAAYSDTDSLKCKSHPLIPSIIEEYNADIARQLKAAGLTHPAFHDLGMFDADLPDGYDAVKRFKTLGAKRYLTEYVNTETGATTIKATIAGLPKATIKHQTDEEGHAIDPFDLFDVDGMEILAENSDKLTTCYNDDYTAAYIDGELMEELSSVALYEIPFTMYTDDVYYNLLFDANVRKKFE